MSESAAIERICVECGKPFLVPAAEQAFRRERALGVPDACPACRSRLREARNADLIALYERTNSFTGTAPAAPRRNRGGNGHASTRAPGPRARYATVCAACGAETQVPFVPRGDRPVYCRECFNARRGR